MNEDGSVDEGLVLTPWRFGIEVFRAEHEIAYLWGRWRFIWYTLREDWRVDWIFNEGVWQVEIGPAVLVYVRDEDY